MKVGLIIGLIGLGIAIFLGFGVIRSNQQLQLAQGAQQEEATVTQWLGAQGVLWVGPANRSANQELLAQVHQFYFGETVRHLRRALDWNIYSTQAKLQLNALGLAAERQERFDLANRAYRELRSRLYASRSLWLPSATASNTPPPIKAPKSDATNVTSGNNQAVASPTMIPGKLIQFGIIRCWRSMMATTIIAQVNVK